MAIPACLCLLLNAATLHDVLVDDAWIFYRYASNWAAGLGPVYNVADRVEGYSSLLWTALLAAGARLSCPPEWLAPRLGLGFACVTLVIVGALARRCVPRLTWLPVVATLAASLSTGLAYFAVAGMDTPLFACVLLAATLCAARWLDDGRSRPLSIALAALVLVRAEGAAYVVTLLAVLGVIVARDGDARLRSQYRLIAGWTTAVVALQFGGRRIYYGEWISTPALSKAFLEHAIRETRRLHLSYSALVLPTLKQGLAYQRHVLVGLIAPVVLLVMAGARGLRELATAWMALSLVAVNALLIVLAAGDWMPYQRLGIAVWPFVLLLAGWTCVRMGEWWALPPRGVHVVAILVVLAVGLFRFEMPAARPRLANILAPQEQGGSLLYRQVGEVLATSDPAVTLVTNIAGKLPYYAGSRTRVIDLMGLTDRWNATHGDRWSLWFGRTDYAVTFQRPFDLFITSSPFDLIELAKASAAGATRAPDLLFFPSHEWMAISFYVAADARHPIVDAMARRCACSPEGLTEATAGALVSGPHALR